MAINFEKIESCIKELGAVADNREFLRLFLDAYDFPKTTYARIIWPKQNVRTGVYVQHKIYYVDTDSPSLYSEFGILKRNGLDRIHADFLMLVSKKDVLACDLTSLDIINVRKTDLYKNIEFFYPLLGIPVGTDAQTNESVDIKVAEKFARLYNEIALNNGGNETLAADVMCRVLFCCFLDSAGCLSIEKLSSIISKYTDIHGDNFCQFFNHLFLAIRLEHHEALPRIFEKINYVDTRLFTSDLPEFNVSKESRAVIIELLDLDWNAVTPEILGALIQSIAVPSASGICGNYTATANINKLIGPLYMNELYTAFGRSKDNSADLLVLLNRVQSITVFDPACGAGNFLLVAYNELYKLATLICDRLAELDVTVDTSELISAQQFFGIEERSFSCNIAKLGFLFSLYQHTSSLVQALNAFLSVKIINSDPLQIDWVTVCDDPKSEVYIIGNPSYRGANRQTPTQKNNLQRVFKDYKNCKNLDYAACWFLLAAKYLKGRSGGFAFVTTNSLTQGNQVQLLWPKIFDLGYYIQFAHTSFKWKNSAQNRTAVTVVIIGLMHSTSRRESCELFYATSSVEPKSISPYLVAGKAVIGDKATSISGLPEMVKGNMPYDGGKLLLSPAEKNALLRDYPDAAEYLRHVVGSDEFINGRERWCLWIHDNEAEEALKIRGIYDRVESVRLARSANSDPSVRRIANRAYQFRDLRETHTLSLVIPAVYSENYLYTPIGFIFKDTIATNLVSVIYDCEPWILGIIASQMHNVWIRTVCGKLEERIRYSLKLGYNTFPIPCLTDEQKALITKCVFNIISIRENHSGKTLSALYHKDRMPDDLRLAHSMLDEVIDKCYRSEPFLTYEDRLAVLFELYERLEG